MCDDKCGCECHDKECICHEGRGFMYCPKHPLEDVR